jgi:fused signal recognition particle receptor
MNLLLMAVISILIAALFVFLSRSKRPLSKLHDPLLRPIPVVPQKKWADRLVSGLAQSREQVWEKISSLVGRNNLDQDTLDQIEEILFSADVSTKVVGELTLELKKMSTQNLSMDEIKKNIFDFLRIKMQNPFVNRDQSIFEFKEKFSKPKVIMIVGVNGAGKTTTIGKLATKLQLQGAKVVVGACDTFRAAAVDQLQVWCDRAKVEMVRAKEGASPSGVAYESLQRAINADADYCLLDTAGRLHTKEGLMDELKKTKNVLKKLMPDAPDHTFLVIDAITGQNAIKQAEEFHKTLGLSGLIFTKCDGSSKAGSAISIVENLQIPIFYIGVGESVDDLDAFDLEDYLKALIGIA